MAEAGCPELATLEAMPLAADVRAHVDACASCRLVIDVFSDHGDSGDSIDACLRYDALLAARGDGTLNSAGTNLLERHLASCPACRAVAETLSPALDAHGDLATLPSVDPASYSLGLEVARGGMGRIIAARDLRVGRPVAVKELLGRSPGLAARFEREARVTARLQHPGIVPIYEIGRWPDGTPFYSMRMVDGRTLGAAIDRATTPAARLALLPALISACEAVAFAHSQRVIHRDLTPANVLVGAYGETVVIDWGLAKDLSTGADDNEAVVDPYRGGDQDGALTSAGAIVGTLAYMPPEQASGQPVDERADVYALGAILYHLLAGAPPHRGRTQNELLAQVKAGDPTPIERVAPGSPRDLVSIVTKAMRRRPDGRYPSARELAEELTRFQTGRMVEAHQYSRLELVRRFVRRNRAAVTVTALAAIVLATAGVIFVTNILRSRAEARDTVNELVFEKGRVELLDGNPLRAIAYLYEAYQAGRRGPAIELLLGTAMSDIATSERTIDCGGDVRHVDFSPDGKHVAIGCHDLAKVWELATGKLVATLGDRVPGGFDGILYSHDGATLATWGSDPVIRLWDAHTGAARGGYAHGAGVTYVTFTPDDRRMASTGDDGFAKIWTIGVPAAPYRAIHANTSPVLPRLFGVLSPDGTRLMTSMFQGTSSGWNVETGEREGGYDHGSLVSGGKLAPNGKLSVSCDLSGVVKVWDATRGGEPLLVVPAHSAIVWKCVFSNDSTKVLTTSHDGTAKIFDATTGALLVAVAHGDTVWIGEMAPDDRRFVTVGVGGRVKVWDASSGALLANYDSHGGRDARFSPDGRRLVVLRGDERIQIWGLPTTRVASFAPPAKADIVAATADATAVAIDLGHGMAIEDRAGARAARLDLQLPVAAAGDRFVATSASNLVVVDAAGATVATIALPAAPIALRASSDGARVAVMYATAAPEVWELGTKRRIARLDGATDALLSHDGRRAIAWRSGAPPAVWSVDTGTRLVTLAATDARPAAFATAGTRVVLVEHATQRPHAISLWDADTGQQLVYQSDTNVTPTVDPSGRWLTTIGTDRSVAIRSTLDGSLHRSFSTDQLFGAQASADGELIAAIGDYGRAVVVISTDGRVLARWPIAQLSPSVTPSAFEPPSATVWWTPDGAAVVGHARNVDVWNATNPYPDAMAALVRTRVPWRVESGKLELVRNSRLVGRVVRDGAALANARIQIAIRRPAEVGTGAVNWESLRAQVSTREQASGADGEFAFDELVLGEYTITVTSGDRRRTQDIVVGADEPPIEIDLRH